MSVEIARNLNGLRLPTRPALGVPAPLRLSVHTRKPFKRLPFPLGDERSALFARGPHAFWQGVQALGLADGDDVLVPAYHEASTVEALVRAGLEPSFYDVTTDLEPSEAALEALLGPRVRALLIVHYFGFPQDSARWRRWCDEHGLFLLEDAAHAWLAERDGLPVGSLADLAVFCLYNSFGLPDGAALRVRAPAPGPEARRPLGLAGLLRRHTAAWRAESNPDPSGGGLALGDPASPPSAATLYLIPRYGGMGAAVASTIAATVAGVVVAVLFARALGARLGDLAPRASDLPWLWGRLRSRLSRLQGGP